MPEYDPPNAFYTQITLPAHIKPEVFIGKEGCHLKRMTELSGCEYLWYDFKRGVIEVWGKEHRLPKALRMLKKRIDSFEVEQKPKTNSYVENVKEPRVITACGYPRITEYEIIGTESEAMKYYFSILTNYPHNPYFTKIESKEILPDGKVKIIVKRSSTSD
jgi:hypothetical protein